MLKPAVITPSDVPGRQGSLSKRGPGNTNESVKAKRGIHGEDLEFH